VASIFTNICQDTETNHNQSFHPGYRELLEEQKQLNQSQHVVKDTTQEILELQQHGAAKLSVVLDLLEGYQRNLDQHQQLLLQNDGKKIHYLHRSKNKEAYHLQGKITNLTRRMHTLAILPWTHWTSIIGTYRHSHSRLP